MPSESKCFMLHNGSGEVLLEGWEAIEEWIFFPENTELGEVNDEDIPDWYIVDTCAGRSWLQEDWWVLFHPQAISQNHEGGPHE